tara:strand:- start:2842 stop:3276 length:435 start_codon:yes stop_codon:yes gene_type:complete
MPSNPKVVVLEDIVRPGDPLVPGGGTRTFQMSCPVAFTGRRLVIACTDAVTFESRQLIVRAISHDNNQLIANGSRGTFNTDLFHPDVGFVGAGSLGFTSIWARWNEKFSVADNFSVTLQNFTPGGINVSIYWVTDYGDKCQKCA